MEKKNSLGENPARVWRDERQVRAGIGKREGKEKVQSWKERRLWCGVVFRSSSILLDEEKRSREGGDLTEWFGQEGKFQ